MIAETIETINLHFKRARSAYEEIKSFEKELDSNIFEDFEKVKTIDTFIFRFIKIQDLIGDKLFKEFLSAVGNYKDNMTMLDMLDILEKLEILESSESWMTYRNLRNTLTHEYPNNEDEMVDGIKIALNVFLEIDFICKKIVHYLNKKKII